MCIYYCVHYSEINEPGLHQNKDLHDLWPYLLASSFKKYASLIWVHYSFAASSPQPTVRGKSVLLLHSSRTNAKPNNLCRTLARISTIAVH